MARDLIALSHGAPSLLTGNSSAKAFLKQLGEALPEPKAWIVVSAHWESPTLAVTGAERPSTVHDFSGFSPELHQYEWPAQGDPHLADTLATAINKAGLAAGVNPNRGLDHGVWVPMALMRPEPVAPVIQVSLPSRHTRDELSQVLGEALAPFAADDYQLIFSGSLTHSLHDAFAHAENAPATFAAQAFANWARPVLDAGDLEQLSAWRAAPHALHNHPTPEHFRPFIAALAAAGGGGEPLHKSYTHGALAMDVWRFPPQA